MLSKLTLSIDPIVVAQAKQYAHDSHTSLSRLVENYLRQIVTQSDSKINPGPVLSQISGILQQDSEESYHSYLEDKYL